MSAGWPRIPRRAYLVSALAVLLALLAAGLVGWGAVSAHAARQVQVTWLPDHSHCTDHSIRPGPRSLDMHGVPVLNVRTGTSCALLVQVTNRSTHPVRVDSLIGELLGLQSSHILTAINASDGGRPPGERIDAYWPVKQTIPPHHTFRYRVGVGYRPSGCDGGPGVGPMGIGGFPDAHITVLGRGYTRRGSTPLHWTQRGPSPGCPLR